MWFYQKNDISVKMTSYLLNNSFRKVKNKRGKDGGRK